MNKDIFKNDLEKMGVILNKEQLLQFDKYYHFLIEYNKITNLTRITDEEDVYYKHFYDSISICRHIDMNNIKEICDIGSGAGFPGVPLKIIFPHLKLSIVDCLKKRITFLEKLSIILELKDIDLIHDRAEKYAMKNKEKFDLITARAFAHLGIIVEIAAYMLKKNGYICAMKGADIASELVESHEIIKKSGTHIDMLDCFRLPSNYGTRNNVYLIKSKPVLLAPRSFSLMKKESVVMNERSLELIFPSPKYMSAYNEMNREFVRNGILSNYKDIDMDFFIKIEEYRKGIDLPKEIVPSTLLWLVDGDRLLGEVSIRHELNDFLSKYGGHIGYKINYNEQNKGYGTIILLLALEYIRKNLKIPKVLVTCDDKNTGSSRIIEKNGGVLEDKVKNVIDGKQIFTRRYWIHISSDF